LYGKADPLPAGVTPTLEMVAGPNAPSVTRIVKPVTVLGRGQRMADVDVGDGSASRRHAYIKYQNGAFWLSDMGSTNGTVLNGELVAEAKLESGDEIQIGTAVMRFDAKR
jgi:pSer/pThr/pTyr-binding forkhead associated (FHA) protein